MKPWPHSQPELVTDELLLRQWLADDIDAVYTACQSADIQRWTTVPSPYHRSDAVEFITGIAPAMWRDRTGAAFAVVEAASDQLVASTSLQHVRRESGGSDSHESVVGEIGYWVSPAYRGRRVASRSARAVASWALESLGMNRIEILVEPDNAASRTAALAAGGRDTGLACGRCEGRDGLRRDVIVYVIERAGD